MAQRGAGGGLLEVENASGDGFHMTVPLPAPSSATGLKRCIGGKGVEESVYCTMSILRLRNMQNILNIANSQQRVN